MRYKSYFKKDFLGQEVYKQKLQKEITKETKHLVPVNQDKPQTWKRQPLGYGIMPCEFPTARQM